MTLSMIGCMALGGNCEGPSTIDSISFCGRILDSAGRPLHSGVATFHAVWKTKGVTYDSDYYGAPKAQIQPDGKASFKGGAGFSTDMSDFELISLTVTVEDSGGGVFAAPASHLKYAYDVHRHNLNAKADFVLQPDMLGFY
jgi:hypothetical protein